MEDALGAPLLERVRGQVRLTSAGHAFLPHAEAVLAAIRDGKDAVRAATSKESGSVSLAIVGTLADTYLVEILRKFARRSSVADLNLRTATSQEVSDLVRRGDVTLGLRYKADTRGGLEAEIVSHENLRVIAAPDHPLKARRLRPADIARQRWIGFPVQRGRESSGAVLHQRFAAMGIENVRMTLIDSLTAQKRLVQAGFGVAMVPESSVREELRSRSLVALDVPILRAKVPIALIYRRKGYLNAAARELAALIGSANSAAMSAART